ncbi:MAG: S1C family serine protease [Aggregatilineales bacterium]
MADVLQSLSDALAGVVEKTAPGVVCVEGRRRLPATGIVWSSDGVIVTAHHVLERNEDIGVGLHDDLTVPAALVGRDPSTDLAVLRVNSSLTPPAWSDADDLKVGHLVLALGRPGAQMQATLGVVSALGEVEPMPSMAGMGRGSSSGRYSKRKRREGISLRSSAGYFVQTDVVMYPGFSGGPLVDAFGFVRGLNTSALLRGVSLTVPASVVRRVVDALLTHGKVKRGYLGVGAQPVRLPQALAEQLEQEIGLMVLSVESNSPAERGGLLQGDILVALDNCPLQSVDELLMLLSGDRIGEQVAVRAVRGGRIVEVTIQIGERE